MSVKKYDYYRRWVRTGLWEKINQTLVQQVRQAQGRELQHYDRRSPRRRRGERWLQSF